MDEMKTIDKNLKTIEEGLCKIEFPEYDKVSSDAPVFYNPRMELNRDNSILAIQTFQKYLKRDLYICDLFGGSGIRGIRYKKEIEGVEKVTINDISSIANEFTKINIRKNELEDIEITQKEANILLRNNRGKFDVIDIDPFGTPSYFLDSAAYCCKKNSLLCVTATDTSALSGTYKAPCIRKYNSKPYKSEYYHETGIRILAGFVALTLAKYKKYCEIKLAHSSEHYMRIYFEIKKGSKASDDSLKNIGYISHCKHCSLRITTKGLASSTPNICPDCGEKLIHAGPLWLGRIQDETFINLMIKEAQNKKLNQKDKVLKLLNKCLAEANGSPTFYDVHALCRLLKINAPKYDLILEELKNKGYNAYKTHFSDLGIKTNAPCKEIKEIVFNLSTNQ